MRVQSATPGMSMIEVEHGPGFVLLRVEDALAQILHPTRARQLGHDLIDQAAEADRLLAATTRAIPPLEG